MGHNLIKCKPEQTRSPGEGRNMEGMVLESVARKSVNKRKSSSRTPSSASKMFHGASWKIKENEHSRGKAIKVKLKSTLPCCRGELHTSLNGSLQWEVGRLEVLFT